ncbi:alpha-glucosidase [Paenibacillus favisporus]|uniref:alpha-glucosidase n=1 Tax=Paenibacillus favisporus TaxID=221028 RepID=UPI002DBE46AE|nr:alpha-glucosidase [Paenibacillus favisporus]MEC0178528.1 alpha-glucosidase [Paenibacillus favisporus]
MGEKTVAAETPWWKSSVFYEIYMPSFCDGNGDGTGDFQGLTSKLDYLRDLGIGGIWLTPFYPSPCVDNGYDISDYYGVDPVFGTMDDFDRFVRKAHQRGIRVIADLVLNHTSAEHPWFIESRSSRTSPKRDWYIWKDAVDGGTPNHWESFFGGTAWEWDEATGQYYYHAFAKEQVDLNWANPEVREAMKEVMSFWLGRGIDGFRLDVINFLKVSGQFKENPVTADGEQDHRFDQNQEGIVEAIRDICEFVRSQNKDVFMVGEVGSEVMEVLRRYSGGDLLDVVFNFNLGSRKELKIQEMFAELVRMEELHRPDQVPTIFFSSHDMPRHYSRFSSGDDSVDLYTAKLMAALMLTAKGVPFIYYGDEIGMRDFVPADIGQMRDIQGLTAYRMAKESGMPEADALTAAILRSRDHSRTPMQWDGSRYGGFSLHGSWIPLGPSSQQVHVQKQWGSKHSLLEFYRSLIRLRGKHKALQTGKYTFLKRKGECIYYGRQSEEEEIWVALNFGNRPCDLNHLAADAASYRLLLTSKETSADSNRCHSLVIDPFEAAVWATNTNHNMQ